MSISGQQGALTRATNAVHAIVEETTAKIVFWKESAEDTIITQKNDMECAEHLLRAKAETLDSTMTKFALLVDKLDDEEQATIDAAEVILEKGNEAMDKYHEALDQLTFQIRRVTPKPAPQVPKEATTPPQEGSPASPDQLNGSRTIQVIERQQLPKIPKFRGNSWEFSNFWALFEEVMEQSDWSELVKFNKLLESLEGDPRMIVSKYISSENKFKMAVDHLKRRYDDKEAIIAELTKQLQNEKASSQSTKDQRQLLDRILCLTTQLKDLKENIESRMLKDGIIGKFSIRIREAVFKKKKKSDGEWTMTKILEDLEVIISNEEELNRYMGREDAQRPKNSDSKVDHRRDSQQTDKKQYPCYFCKKEDHRSANCRTISNLKERSSILEKDGRCLKCMQKGHKKDACKSTRKCFICNSPDHNTVLCNQSKDRQKTEAKDKSHHPPPQKTKTQAAAVAQRGREECDDAYHFVSSKVNIASTEEGGQETFIPTIQAMAFNPRGDSWSPVCLMVDTGANQSYVRDQLVEDWSLPKKGSTEQSTRVFGSSEAETQWHNHTGIQILTEDNRVVDMELLTTPHLAGSISKCQLTPEDMRTILKNKWTINEDSFQTRTEPDILLGCDYISQIVEGQMNTLPSGISLLNTKMGWTTMGRTKGIKKLDNQQICMTVQSIDMARIIEDNQKLDMQMKSPNEFTGPLSQEQSEEDKKTLEFFEETIEKRDNGYYVRLPLIEDAPQLPDNFGIAISRLQKVQGQYSEEVLQKMEDVFQEQEARGYIERVSFVRGDQTGRIHYNPCQPVITPHKTTTKCRVVVDGSSHQRNQPSLNDIIKKGPVILPDIVDMLIRFRAGSTVIISDVEKAFLQVFLHEDDRDFTRVLWLKDFKKPATMDNVIVYRFTRVLFGLNVSPFLLAATILHHLDQQEDKQLAKDIANSLYVDNLVQTTDMDGDQAIQIYHRTKSMFNDMGMNMREFRSNSDAFNDAVEEKDKSAEDVMKVLGVPWSSKEDTITMKAEIEDIIFNSRRTISSAIASIFDPMGFLAPLLLQAKLFQRDTMWNNGYGWDTQISDDHNSAWIEITEGIHDFEKTLPRHVVDKQKKNKLVVFTDASKEATACCIYVVNDLGSNLIFGKSKIKPLKETWTIPKLETQALRMGTDKALMAVKALQEGGIEVDQVVILTDSTIALDWLKSKPGREKSGGVFIDNRIKAIIEAAGQIEERGVRVQFGHIMTDQNPADLGTRGCIKEDFEGTKWWNGPIELTEPMDKWTSVSKLFSLTTDTLIQCAAVSAPPLQQIFDTNVTNSFNKMKRVTAYVLLFIKKAAKGLKEDKRKEMEKSIPFLKLKESTTFPFTSDQIQEAEIFLITDHQKSISSAEKKKWINLGLITNERGLIVCKGRLEDAELPDSTKFPIFIKPKTQLAKMIIMDSLRNNLHMCTLEFLNALRRFVAIRGVPDKIISDNGSNFVLGQKLIQDAIALSPEELQTIQWKFITPYSPWKGGFYERLIKSIKHIFWKSQKRAKLSSEELRTVFYEIAAAINSRPLTTVEDDINSGNALRPMDFINPEMKIVLPIENLMELKEDYRPSAELNALETKMGTIEALKSSMEASSKAWKKWQSKYLAELREHHKSRMDNKRGSPKLPREGQIVLLCDENQPRNTWKLARITEVIISSDQVIRDVHLITDTGRTLNRSINQIVPLEIDEDTDMETEVDNEKPDVASKETDPTSTPNKDDEESVQQKSRYNLRKRKPIDYDEDNGTIARTATSIINPTIMMITMIISLLVGQTSGAVINTTPTQSKLDVKCTDQGLRIRGQFQAFEACSETYCTNRARIKWKNNDDHHIWLPAAIKIHPHHSTVKINDGQEIKIWELDCPAIDFCETIECTFCFSNIANPECNIWFAIIGLGGLGFVSLMMCHMICNVPVRIGDVFRLAWTITKGLLYFFGQIFQWIQRKVGRRVQRRNRLRTVTITIVFIVFTVEWINACQEVDVIQQMQTVCTTEGHCSSFTEEVMDLNQYKNEGCLRIERNGTTTKDIRVQLQEVELHCTKRTIVYTKDVTTRVWSSKRCPGMGSCQEEKCSNITRSSVVPELDKVNHMTGISGCSESCGGPGCGCFYWSSGCLFYRIYADPISEEPIEIFECTDFLPIAKLKVTVTTLNSWKNQAETMEIKNPVGHTTAFKDIAITTESIQIPPSPGLQTWFIRRSTEMATWPHGQWPRLQCERELKRCSLQEKCQCTAAEKQMQCTCEDHNIHQHLLQPDNHLPAQLGHIRFEKSDQSIIAKIRTAVDTKVTLKAKDKWKTLIVKSTETCSIPTTEIKGCYSCDKGANAEIVCTSNEVDTIGNIECGEEVFAVQCNKTGQKSILNFHAEAAKFATRCTVDCGGKNKGQFEITGILKYSGSIWTTLYRMLDGNTTIYNEINFPDTSHLIESYLSYIKTIMTILVLVGLGFIIVYAILTTAGWTIIRKVIGMVITIVTLPLTLLRQYRRHGHLHTLIILFLILPNVHSHTHNSSSSHFQPQSHQFLSVQSFVPFHLPHLNNRSKLAQFQHLNLVTKSKISDSMEQAIKEAEKKITRSIAVLASEVESLRRLVGTVMEEQGKLNGKVLTMQLTMEEINKDTRALVVAQRIKSIRDLPAGGPLIIREAPSRESSEEPNNEEASGHGDDSGKEDSNNGKESDKDSDQEASNNGNSRDSEEEDSENDEEEPQLDDKEEDIVTDQSEDGSKLQEEEDDEEVSVVIPHQETRKSSKMRLIAKFPKEDTTKKCVFCSDGHYADRCPVITTAENRRQFLSRHDICRKCLHRKGSGVHQCKENRKCYYCNSNEHNSSVCSLPMPETDQRQLRGSGYSGGGRQASPDIRREKHHPDGGEHYARMQQRRDNLERMDQRRMVQRRMDQHDRRSTEEPRRRDRDQRDQKRNGEPATKRGK
ncbi:unnamed protein product [Caenorhabditis nigoni]